MRSYFSVNARWLPRREDTSALALRLADYFSDLATVDPLFENWVRCGSRSRSIVPLDVSIPAEIPEMHAWLDESARFESRNGRKTMTGNGVHAETVGENPHASFWLDSDLTKDPETRRGYITHGFLVGGIEPPRIRRMALGMLASLVTAWDVAWAAVAPGDFSGYAPPEDPVSRMFQAGWAVYLAPELADKITLSEDLKITTQANGGIVMMAAGELFDPRLPAHLAMARQIEVALAPLNYPKMPRPPT